MSTTITAEGPRRYGVGTKKKKGKKGKGKKKKGRPVGRGFSHVGLAGSVVREMERERKERGKKMVSVFLGHRCIARDSLRGSHECHTDAARRRNGERKKKKKRNS